MDGVTAVIKTVEGAAGSASCQNMGAQDAVLRTRYLEA